ncbi:flagellar basal body rod protein [Actinomycetes bacterium NPDC127524]|uniref:lmo0954 family membrane protein n=1 Tax=Bacillus sp. MUM 13 TaxID=1678001 RepID=UPI0008F5D2AB|nr:flagellar basal body rod protein [Bacillus sp. MUM 13]OIK12485.1 flagellar basal body rod protein [Bacillus sp. MUM 13]
MKKFGLAAAGVIAAMILLANVGPLAGLAISLVILYFVFKQFIKAESAWGKVIWAIISLAALSAAIANIPSVIGIAAALVLYFVYKKWNGTKSEQVSGEKDPFINFEKQWADLNKN